MLTVAAWWAVVGQVDRAERVLFQQRTDRVLAMMRGRFAAAKQAAFGARALIEASDDLSPGDWVRYVEAVSPFLREGVIGLGRVERIPRDGIEALERRVRSEGLPGFRIERVGDNPWLYVVTRIEPIARNRGALGLDVGSGTIRRRAADRAMVTGLASLTRRIRVIEGEYDVPGFLLFLPVYAPGRALEGPAARTEALLGWVYASIRVDELTQGLATAGGPDLAFAIREAGQAVDEAPLFDTGLADATGVFTRQTSLDVEGEQWRFDFRARSSVTGLGDRWLPLAVLVGGLVATLLVGLLTFTLVTARTRAEGLADTMTARLVASNTELEHAAAHAQSLADEATQANLAKGQFLAMMSHEIRTPMNGVVGMTALLLDSPLTDEQRDYAETIRVSGDALLAVIDDILDFSKIESGRFDLAPAPFDLRALLRDVTAILSPRARAKALRFEVAVAGDVPARLVGDVDRLRQILLNLAGNAIKVTEAGAVVVAITREPPARPDAYRFVVRDTGIGIPPEALPRLFQPFTQVDASTARRFGGTGLGLAISRRLVELMGGEIGVTSVEGEGATFAFVVRLETAAESQPPRPDIVAGPVPSRRGRALLAEDNPINRKVALLLLHRLGWDVDTAEDGRQALEALARQPYDVVLLDIQMPDIDGLEVARRLLASEPDPTRRPWLIAVTANAVAGDRDACLAVGIDDFVPKPVTLDDLDAALARASAARARPESSG